MIFLYTADGTGITEISADAKGLNPELPMYNAIGQPVVKGYKGMVIQNGRKFIVK